ncbi:MAG TPA: amidase family protein [Streptosporangiaceae bacterium]|nr:amidase family protein [Streptosporangiaceae bacterium]
MTVTEHVRLTLAAIEAGNAGLGAFVSVAGDEVAEQARAADRLIETSGEAAWNGRPLLGVTVGVKDLFQTRELPTRRGSLLPNPRPAQDAPAVARLRAAGAIVVGKTATSEYGWSASTVSRLAAPAENPRAPGRSAGGSSGGSAAAVAAGLCDVALGTDGAGSIRIPAAFCGVVGFKPSFGRIPYVPPCADRLAHAGPLTRCVADAAELAAVLAGPHGDDPDSRLGPLTARRASVPGESLTIAWLEFPRTSAEVRAVSERALPLLAAQGHQVERIDVPFGDPYPALVDILAAAEAAATTPADETACDSGRIAIARYGRTISGAAVMQAEATRMALRARLGSVMDRYDLLAMATVPVEPFDAGAIAPAWAADPADLLWLAWTPATYPFNLTGHPAVSVPAGLTSASLPVGIQLVGPYGGDDLLLTAAAQLEADFRPLLSPSAFDAKGR